MKHLPCLLLTVLFLGCGKGEDKTTEPTSPASPSPVAKTKGKGLKPGVEEAPPERPEGFRADVPIFPESKVVEHRGMDDDFAALLTTPQSLLPVLNFYNRHLPLNGWVVGKVTHRGDDEATLEGDKSGLCLEARITHTGEETTIRIQVGKPKEEKLPLLRGLPLPKDFPRDIPLLPDSAVKIVSKDGLKLTLATTRPLEAVRDFYQYQLRKKGWKEKVVQEEETTIQLEAAKEDRRLTVLIDGVDRDVVVVIVRGKEEK